MNYGSNDIRVLQALLRGEAPAIGSAQRLHLEMLGLATDSAQGLRITAKGSQLAMTVQLPPEPVFVTTDETWESRGRWPANDDYESDDGLGAGPEDFAVA
ncbi:MAG TPA: hypothetical protein VFB13_09935 [Reyranella sp.]|nr:hypothetical protein [Reyranella sp.]